MLHAEVLADLEDDLLTPPKRKASLAAAVVWRAWLDALYIMTLGRGVVGEGCGRPTPRTTKSIVPNRQPLNAERARLVCEAVEWLLEGPELGMWVAQLGWASAAAYRSRMSPKRVGALHASRARALAVLAREADKVAKVAA